MIRKSFISGALILMFAGFISKIIGFVYRVYLSNLIGAEGMGLFQLIAPFYSLIILTLTSGISISVSRLIAKEYAKNRHANLGRIMVCGLQLVVGASMIISIICFAYAEVISNSVLKDGRTYSSLILLIPCIPIIAAASAIKGYFYGIQEMVPTAVSQIVEQVVRIGFIMALAGWFLKAGLEYACAAAILGTALGEISNLTVLFLVYHFGKRRAGIGSREKDLLKRTKIFKELISEALPISFNRFIVSILGAIEAVLIPARLMIGGISHQHSMEVFGKLAGMAMPLIFFPSIITSALATALIPAVSESVSSKNFKAVNHRISRSIQMSIVLGVIFTVIFSCYPDQISDVIYKRDKIGGVLYLLSFTCLFLYLQQTLTGVLNGLGKQSILLGNSLIGSFIRIGFVYFYIPLYGIQGYVWGIIIGCLITCLLNLFVVKNETGLSIDLIKWLFKPGIAGLVMAGCSKYIYSFFTALNVNALFEISMTLTANMLIALELMVIFGVIEKGELKKLLKINKMFL